MYLGESVTPVWRGRLPAGDRGTRVTLEIMRRLACAGGKDPVVREAAIAIVKSAGVAAHDFAGELKAIFEHVRDRIRFTRDPLGVEALQAPRYTLKVAAGDCDDKATLLASLLAALGNPAQLKFRVIALDKANPRRFSHVYVVAKLGAREVAMDPTWQDTPLGWQHPKPARIGGLALCT